MKDRIEIIKHNFNNSIELINLTSKRLSKGQSKKYYHLIKMIFCYTVALLTPAIVMDSLLGVKLYDFQIENEKVKLKSL